MVSWALWVEWHPCAHPLDARSTPGHDDHRCPQTSSVPCRGGGTYCSVLKLLFEIPCLSGHKSCCPPSEGKPPFGQDPVISVHEPRESWGPSRSWGLWAAQVARQSHGCNLSTPKPGDSGQVSRHT